VSRRFVTTVLVCLLAVAAAGCGSSSKHARTTTAQAAGMQSLRLCLRRQGYAISPESARVRGTAPRAFEFLAVWNLLNPDRIALAVTISKSANGAKRVAAWTRKTNARIGKGVVHAPVVRFGRINVLWTNDPDAADRNAIYGCVRAAS
jgi:hypothetical protein